jgi:hypothetical protein
MVLLFGKNFLDIRGLMEFFELLFAAYTDWAQGRRRLGVDREEGARRGQVRWSDRDLILNTSD